MLRKNVASQFLHIAGVNASTGAIVAGATWTMRRCLDGTFAAGGATLTEDGSTGFYKVALTQADTNGNNIGYFFTATSCVPVALNVVATAADPTDSVRFGLTALPNAAAGANTGLPVVGTQVPNATAGAAGGMFIAGTNAATTVTTSFTTTFTGNLTGSVGSVTGAVGSVTGAVGSVTGNVGGNVTGTVGSVVGAVGSVTGAVGSVTGNVGGNVVGSVASVTANVNADMVKISGSTAAADALEESTEAIGYGTVDGAGATTTAFLTSALTPDSAVNDQFNGRVLIFKSDTTTAALRGQATTISDWAHTSGEIGTFTVVALTTAPSTGDTFTIL